MLTDFVFFDFCTVLRQFLVGWLAYSFENVTRNQPIRTKKSLKSVLFLANLIEITVKNYQTQKKLASNVSCFEGSFSMTIKIMYFARTICFIAFALSLLTGCGTAVKVIEPVKYEGQTVPFFSRDMEYIDLVWSDSEIMALVNTPPSSFTYKLQTYDFLLDEVREIEVPVPDGCSTTDVAALRRLPNSQIGLMLSCRNDELLLVGYRLVEWDRKNSEFVMLEQLDDASFLEDRDYFHPGGFIYSPDFRMLFMERNDDGVNNRLVMLDTQTKHIEDFIPQFARSGSPAWSDDGTLLAFAANGDANNNPLHRANDINGAWNIYIMEPDKVEPQLVLNNITHVAYMKWRPNSHTQLTFRGMYKGKKGLWLYDIESKKMRFIWP